MQSTTKPEPTKWEITAKTFRCEFIGDYVTVTITRDWLAKCAWCLKYKTPRAQGAPAMKNTDRAKITMCIGPDCPLVTKYRDQLVAEEAGKESPG